VTTKAEIASPTLVFDIIIIAAILAKLELGFTILCRDLRSEPEEWCKFSSFFVLHV
jgi:hypothetical protein